MTKVTWTPKDIKVLQTHYGKLSLVKIGEKVGRSPYAVGMYLAKHRDAFPYINPPTRAMKKALKARGPWKKGRKTKGGKK